MDEFQTKNIVALALHLLEAHFDGLEDAAREHPSVYLALERRGLIGPRKAESVILLERLYHALAAAPTAPGEGE